MVQTIPFPPEANLPFVHACPAHRLDPEQRQQLALHALTGTQTITYLADQNHVSRKFVYQQVEHAQQALDQAFTPPPSLDDEVLFDLPVTKRWLWQIVLALLLICRSSFRGV